MKDDLVHVFRVRHQLAVESAGVLGITGRPRDPVRAARCQQQTAEKESKGTFEGNESVLIARHDVLLGDQELRTGTADSSWFANGVSKNCSTMSGKLKFVDPGSWRLRSRTIDNLKLVGRFSSRSRWSA